MTVINGFDAKMPTKRAAAKLVKAKLVAITREVMSGTPLPDVFVRPFLSEQVQSNIPNLPRGERAF